MIKIYRIIGILVLIGTLIYSSSASISLADSPRQEGGQGGVRIVKHDQTGFTVFVGVDNSRGAAGLPGATFTAGAPSADTALADITTYAADFGLNDPARELTLTRSRGLQGGSRSFRYQQTFQGIPILAGEIIANYNAQGFLVALTGEISPSDELQGLSTTPTVTSAVAAQNALGYVARSTGVSVNDLTTTTPELWIYDPRLLTPNEFPPALVWRMEVTSTQTLPIRYLVLVSASFGSINLAFNQIDTFWEEPGAARVQTEQLIPETGISSDLAYRLPNHANPPGATYNSHHTADLTGTGSSTLVCSTPPTALTGAGSCDGTGSATRANAAHYFAYNTVNYYDSHHQRNSINNAGLNLISNVDYREETGIPYENAYWDGTQMVYGDGDVFTVDDVIGHELSHGVTQYESNLFYFYESGAMNEMFSDIFGEFTDQWNGINSTGGTESVAQKWLIGEDMSIGAMRNMANPPSGSPAQPDRTQSGLYFQGTGDNGGVHYNSGVGNKAAYLLAVGGTFNGYTITALGNDKTSAIFYEVNTTLLTSGADYNVLGVALVQACNNIRSGANPLGITAADCTEVDEAVHATEMHIDPVASIDWTPSAALCPTAGDVVTEALFSTTFEGDGGADLAGFTDGVIINPTTMPTTSAWQEALDTGVPYAINSVRSAFGVNHPGLYGYNNLVDYDAFTRLTSAVALPAGSTYYLYFDHAFGFEQWEDFFGDVWEPDGGVLEYSTAGSGGPWTDAGALFQAGQNYNGVVESDTGMAPLEGRSAFIVDSHGYVSSRYNLTSLAGQNVWFRWRIGGDSFGYLGWWLDNVQIYRCAPSAPEIAAEGHSATPISDGGTYNMGTTPLGTALVRTITVRNVGSLPLTISTNPPTITGDFTAGTFGTTTIAGGSSTTFSLTCNASTLGSPVVGTVSFGNNDSNENPFNFTVNCTVTAPEIAVEGHSATAINDGGIYEMGTTPLGEPLVRTITVRNTGTATLSITTNPPTVTGNFTAGTFASTSIAAGTSTTFNLTCTAAALGSPIEGTVSFVNNDANENPFDFTVRCNVASPEIEVRAPDDSLINDGGTYSLGSTTLGVPITQTIRVNSIGSDPVIISDDPPIVSTGFSAGNFGSTTIAAGDFTTFDLTCDATAGGSPVTGTVSFGNNDTNENPFNFTVTCTVTAPEIEVRSPDNTLISDGSLYHLGSTPMGVPLTRIITVKNTGTGSATLILSSTAPTVTGPYSAGNFGSTAIAPGFSTTFDLTCNATIAGTNVSGNLSFGNNDTNENPFNFMVACNVTVPEIAVEGHLAVAINDNGSYDLGTTSLSQPLTRTITVHNTGGAPLTISTNPPTVTGDFSAGNFGSLTVAAGSSTTFDLTCNASALGTANGTVSFGNSDSNENPFNFSIACTTIVPLDPPALLLPADGILTNDNTPVLSWSPVTNAQSYNYAISEAADMSGAVQLGTTSETTYTVDPVLDDDTTYYWHVRAVGPGGTTASAWSETRSFTVDLLRPAVPVLSSPKDRSNTTDTTPKFSWSKPSGTTQFHLEVDDDPTFGTPINLGATLFLTNSYTVPTLNALPYGGYYWRVQAGNAAGLWSDWSVVRRFTITLLKAPANTAHITDTTPTFSWTKPTGALAFEFQLDNSDDLGSPEIGPIGTGTNATFTPAAGLLPGQYWWSVRVQTINGWSAWMPAWTLTITAPPTVKPTLDQPANGAILADTTPDFHWGTVPDGHHYQIQIDNTSNFSSPVQDVTLAAGLTNYTAAPPLPDGGKYYWRVRAINETNVAGAWSSTSNFTLTQLAAPGLLSPTNKSVTADTTPVFSWNGVLGASSYEIQISTDTNFVTVNHQGSPAGTSYTVPDPSALPAGVYSWRVRAINGSGIAGKWSSKWTFTVDLVGPAAPVLSSPALSSGTPDTTPTFKWAASSGAKLYRIQVTLEDDDEFDDPIFTETSTTTSYTPLNPLAYEFYVWRVQAQDAVGNWGPYSPLERQFFVSLHKSPLNWTSTTNARPTFSWNGATGATSYEFELDNNFDFSSPIWEYSGTGKSTRPPTALPPGTYQWRVKANNTAWMLEWTITITPTLPAKPVQVSPANKALLNDNTPTFTWNAVIGATVYQVQIDNQSKFTSPEQDVTVGSLLLNYIASDLTDGTYYWRVRASNSLYAPGSWSSVRSITIDITPPEVPVVTAPVDQTSMTNTKFSLAWSKVKDAVRYEVQIDPDAGFPLPPSDVGNKTTYKPATPLARGVYNWHVRAIDKAGNASAWSPARTFEIVAGVTGADPTQEPTAEILPTEAPPTIDPTEPPTLEPTVIPPDLPLVTLESDDPAVMQTGVWTAHDTELASGGRYLYSSGSLDDALTFTFSGVQLDVIYVKHPALGQFIVEVDGAPLLLADSTAPEAEFGVRGSITLGAGEHTARLYPLFGTIAIDAFEVQTQIAPPVVSTPEPTTEPTAEPTTELTSEPPAEPTLAPTLAPTSTPLPVLLPFGDTFDSGLGWTTSGLWALDPQAARSGMGWWIDSTQRKQVSTLTYSGLIDLTTAQNPQLGFWQKGILSTSDVLSVEVSLDGGLIWWPAQRQSALSADWMWQTVDLNAYRGNVIALRFVLSTVDTLPEGALTAGFGLDDLLIQDVPFTPTLVPPTMIPTDIPTLIPTDIPTLIPTDVPTLEPTESPTEEPTLAPTDPPAEERQTT